MRDESDRQGMRLVIELKREASPRTVLNQLYKHTAMQTAFGINMLALVVEKDEQGNASAAARVLTLKRMLQHFLDYRHEVLTRRTRFELEKARARAHILEGLKIALDNLDAVIRTIRESASAEAALADPPDAVHALSEIQARAILDMQLRRLAALERQQILDEYDEILKTIAYLEDLLANPRKILLPGPRRAGRAEEEVRRRAPHRGRHRHRRRHLGRGPGPERRGAGHDLAAAATSSGCARTPTACSAAAARASAARCCARRTRCAT